MKKLLLLIVGVLSVLPTFAQVFEYTYEGQTLKYTILDEEAKTCAVGSNHITGDLVIPSIAKDGNTVYSVTSIQNNAFYVNSNYCNKDLTSVTIPNSVTTIGNMAFSGCFGLTSVTIGNSVTTIGDEAFYCCHGLTSVTIPNSVTTIGKRAFYYCGGLNELFFNAENCTKCGEESWGGGGLTSYYPFSPTLQKVTFGDNVKTIPAYAFGGCSNLTSVTIPNSVTTIGDRAFYNCSGLTSVTIPNSVTTIGDYAFSGCYGLVEVFFNAENCTSCSAHFPTTLQKVTFGDNVKNIPQNSFSGCSGLTSVTIPNSVTTIGDSAFSGCSITSVTIPNSVAFIGDRAFYGCDGLTELFFNAENCSDCGKYLWGVFPSSLLKVTFGDKVNNIPGATFKECSKLTEVNVPSIESWLNINFENQTANPTYYAKKLLVNGETIRRLTIPEGTKRINAYNFINCEPLVTVTFPTSLESIGNEAFSGCTGLQRDIFPDPETYLGINYDSADARLNYGNDSKIYIGSEEYNPEEIDWPSTLTKIPDYAFYGNKTLKNINIPKTVTEIGKSAFYGCQNLTSMDIPNSITEISNSAFSGCERLSSVTIPNSVTSIGNYAFHYCSRLKSVTIPNSVTEIGTNAFYGSGLNYVIIQSPKLWSQIKFESAYDNPIYVSMFY